MTPVEEEVLNTITDQLKKASEYITSAQKGVRVLREYLQTRNAPIRENYSRRSGKRRTRV